MIGVFVKAARFKAAIRIQEWLIECLIAPDNVFLVLHWQRGKVIVAQDRRRDEFGVKGFIEGFMFSYLWINTSSKT
jgi:hypothetical protein